MRRRSEEDALRVVNQVGHFDLSTLVLADYLEESLLMEWVVSPGDEARRGIGPPTLNSVPWTWISRCGYKDLELRWEFCRLHSVVGPLVRPGGSPGSGRGTGTKPPNRWL